MSLSVQSPTISVVLPTHNRASTLGRAIDSVLQQTYRNFELIVVDDGSLDATDSVITRFDDKRMSYTKHAVRRGGSAARNTGIALARGRLIAFQDSDDEWVPSKLQEQLLELERCGPATKAAYTGLVQFGRGRATYVPGPEVVRRAGDILESLLARSFVSTQTLMADADLLREIGGFDESLPRFQDWDLALRLAARTQFALVDKPLALAYETPGNITSQQDIGLIARQKILEKNAHLYSSRKPILARHLFIMARIARKTGNQDAARQFASQAARTEPANWRYLAALALEVSMPTKGKPK
jgi:glycosyltransferase involved in cell wall biosynthesis